MPPISGCLWNMHSWRSERKAQSREDEIAVRLKGTWFSSQSWNLCGSLFVFQTVLAVLLACFVNLFASSTIFLYTIFSGCKSIFLFRFWIMLGIVRHRAAGDLPVLWSQGRWPADKCEALSLTVQRWRAQVDDAAGFEWDQMHPVSFAAWSKCRSGFFCEFNGTNNRTGLSPIVCLGRFYSALQPAWAILRSDQSRQAIRIWVWRLLIWVCTCVCMPG